MSGVKLRTSKAVNSVMADATVEFELAQLVSEYLQHHRCNKAYVVSDENYAGGVPTERSSEA